MSFENNNISSNSSFKLELELMLKNYLNVTKSDYLVKKELLAKKQKRLDVVQVEYNYSFDRFNDKFDLNSLKTQLTSTQTRIEQLKIELIDLENELLQGSLNLDTLKELKFDQIGDYSIDEALGIVNELKNIRQSIAFGERERKDLVKEENEVKLDEDVTLSRPGCTTDLASLRMEYENLRRQLKEIQHNISNIEVKVSESQFNIEKTNQKGDNLLKKNFNDNVPLVSTHFKLDRERDSLFKQLKLIAKQMALMEIQLKSVSLSTLSSLSSESSKSSLNSLNSSKNSILSSLLNLDHLKIDDYLAKYLHSIVNLNSSFDSGCYFEPQEPGKPVNRSDSDSSSMEQTRRGLFNRQAKERRSLRLKNVYPQDVNKNELENSLIKSKLELKKLQAELNSLKLAKKLNENNIQNGNQHELNERVQELLKKSSIKIEKLKQKQDPNYFLKKNTQNIKTQQLHSDNEGNAFAIIKS
jgi:hypothetical protein